MPRDRSSFHGAPATHPEIRTPSPVVNENIAEPHTSASRRTQYSPDQPVSPGALRVRRHRERRREDLCSFTVEMPKADIQDAIARGKLKSDYDAWDVLDAYYADHLSDTALEWLVANKVVKYEDRNDGEAILCSISDWLEAMS